MSLLTVNNERGKGSSRIKGNNNSTSASNCAKRHALRWSSSAHCSFQASRFTYDEKSFFRVTDFHSAFSFDLANARSRENVYRDWIELLGARFVYQCIETRFLPQGSSPSAWWGIGSRWIYHIEYLPELAATVLKISQQVLHRTYFCRLS